MTESLQNEICNILREHIQKYPRMQPQDVVKLLFQSEFGPGHLIENPLDAYRYLVNELKSASPTALWTEPVGNGVCRLQLGAVREQLSPHTIFRLFLRAVDIHGNAASMNEKCKMVIDADIKFPFQIEDLAEYISQYRANGFPVVHHSEGYRAAYRPAYRVIRSSDRALLPLLAEIDRRAAAGPVCIAIDGSCGSGKTTFARRLAQIFRCNVFHMDDFFLPATRKTAERLAQPGGNVDYERFQSDVLVPLKQGRPFEYRPFSCEKQVLDSPRSVHPKRISVVEGSYAMHPALSSAYDLSIFLTVSPQLQEQRIRERNGTEMWTRFAQEWIPMEQKYISIFGIKDKCAFQYAPEDWIETRPGNL